MRPMIRRLILACAIAFLSLVRADPGAVAAGPPPTVAMHALSDLGAQDTGPLPGDLDTTFSGDGRQTTDIGGSDNGHFVDEGDVKREDYFIKFTTAGMPDPELNGRRARLDVHRVRPAPNGGRAAHAVIFLHGRANEAVSVFDLRYQDYSLMEALAKAGIDTYAVNFLGNGRSRLDDDDPLDDPCNASLPHCRADLPANVRDAACTQAGPLCDCPGSPAGGLVMDQQGDLRSLNPNPLSVRCEHTNHRNYVNTANMANDIDLAVDAVIHKTGLTKVSIVAQAAAVTALGMYLADAERAAKVERAIFAAAIYHQTVVEAVLEKRPSFPLAVRDANVLPTLFNLRSECPGQLDPTIIPRIWQSLKDRDPIAPAWGPRPGPVPVPPTFMYPEGTGEGLTRLPVVSRFGWDTPQAQAITVPVLLIRGEFDNFSALSMSNEIYNDLTATDSKILVHVGCASHINWFESCSGLTCLGWRGPHQTVQELLTEYIQAGTVNGQTQGVFVTARNNGAISQQ